MGTLAAFAAFAIALSAWRAVRKLRGDVLTLRHAVVGLQERVMELTQRPAAPVQPESPPPAMAPEPAKPPETVESTAEPASAPVPEVEISPPAPQAVPTTNRADLEQTLLGRWSVWLGAVALALGGVFLVKYSIERELLGPGLRVFLGLLLGAGMVGTGEFLRHRVPRIELPHVAYLPPAVTAAGIATLFASIWAAHALYAFVGSTVAFAALAAICATAVVLSLRQGPLIALLGLCGALLVPALIHTDTPSGWTLFSYLLIVMAGTLALARDRSWWWLGWTSLAGGVAWSLLWLATAPRDVDPAALPTFLILATALFFFMHRPGDADTDKVAGMDHVLQSSAWLVWAAAATFALLMLLVITDARQSTISVTAAGLLIALHLAGARRDQHFDFLPLGTTLFALAVIASWVVRFPPHSLYGATLSLAPDFPPLISAAASYAALIGITAYALIWRVERPQRWAVAAAGAPVGLLTAGYLHRGDALGELPWAAIALLIAALEVFAASRVARFRDRAGMEAALAAYAVGAVAAVALAFTMSLERAWLTTALALMLPAMGWIAERTRVATLRRVSFVVAAVVLARLVLNRDLIEMPVTDSLLFNWILYSYGLPCVAFALAAWLFGGTAHDHLDDALRLGAAAIGCALVALEIRHAFAAATLLDGRVRAGEIAAYACSLLAMAVLTVRHAKRRPGSIFAKIAPGAAAIACAFTALGPVVIYNPVLTSEAVGETVFFNLLLPLYAAPLTLALWLRIEIARVARQGLVRGVGALCLVLGFVFLSLTVRHAFHGALLDRGGIDDAESYVYSVAWLGYGALLLTTGVLLDNQPIRYAGLAVLTLSVAKTFVVDMSVLTGLYRAASFIGLGASLLGIGYLYQRLVRPPHATARAPAA